MASPGPGPKVTAGARGRGQKYLSGPWPRRGRGQKNMPGPWPRRGRPRAPADTAYLYYDDDEDEEDGDKDDEAVFVNFRSNSQ